MAVDGVTSTNQSSTYNTSNTSPSNELSAEDFMQILAAELQYQDPTKGVDTTQYISQLAQLTSLEQLGDLNDSFSEMMRKQDLIIGSTWIGKEVAVYENDGSISSGLVKGFVITDEGIQVFVNDSQYALDQIAAVTEQTQTDTESAE